MAFHVILKTFVKTSLCISLTFVNEGGGGKRWGGGKGPWGGGKGPWGGGSYIR